MSTCEAEDFLANTVHLQYKQRLLAMTDHLNVLIEHNYT